MSFQKVTDPVNLFGIVEKRLPVSCLVYNQLKSYHKHQDVLHIFTYDSVSSSPEDVWIVTAYRRTDWGAFISVCGPTASVPKNPDPNSNDEPIPTVRIPEAVKEFFLSSQLIDWSEHFCFLAVEPYIFRTLVDIIFHRSGRVVKFLPCNLYVMEIEDALKLEVNPPPGIQVKALDVDTGPRFISDGWPLAVPDKTPAEVRKFIERLPSAGVYVEDKVVCGGILPGFGIVSMVSTDPDHRRKGYATLAMKYLFKEMAKQGLIPCLDADITNPNSNRIYGEKLGMKWVTKCGYILYEPTNFS